VLLAPFVALPAAAGDLTRSVTFTDGQRLSAANLHTLVDGASINATFLTGKSLLGTVDSADFVLVYDTSTGVFTKMTLGTLLLANTGMITTQPEEYNPAPTDYLLLYDASGAQLAKVSVTNLVTGNTNLVVGQNPITNLLSTAQFLVNNGGTNNRISLANLWQFNFEYTRGFTNQLEHTTPTNVDRLLIWDATAGTNKWTTLAGLVTNLPATTNPTNTAKLMIVETGEVKQVSIDTLRDNLTRATFLSTNQTFTGSIALASITAAGAYIDTAHSLGVTPKSLHTVMVCTTADHNYAIGDELDFGNVWQSGGTSPAGTPWANSTNIGFTAIVSKASFQIPNKTTGATATPTEARWTIKIYARP
jgi:hypothetical protein